MLLFYSHGFHSSLDCEAYKRLCVGLNIAPKQVIYDNGGDFSLNLNHCAHQILSVLNARNDFGFIGNSLGAFYLWQLSLFANSLNLPLPRYLVLFNPVLEPLSQLKKYIDKPQMNATTHTPFTLARAQWESYALALRMPLPKSIQCYVVLSKNDELIDVELSRVYWQQYAHIIEHEGGHVIADFAPFSHLLSPLLTK